MSIPERQVLLEHVGFLRAIALGVLRNEADADDAVQQTLATALQKPPADDSNLRGWLATVVRNFARMQLRSRSRRRAREEAVAQHEGTPSTAQIAQRMEMERHVVDAIASLEEPFKTTLILRFYDDLQPKEIAVRMGVPAATVRTRLKRGLDKLRAMLEEKNGGSRKATYAGLLLLAQLPARAAPLRWLPVAGVAAVLIGVVAIVAVVVANSEDAGDSGARVPIAERPDDGDGRMDNDPTPLPGPTVEACVVAGRITDTRGTALAGVEVIAFEHAGAAWLDTPLNRWKRWMERPEELARTTTGEDGEYTLRVEPARPFWIVYQRQGIATRLLPMPDAQGTYRGVDIVLKTVPGVSGRLRGDDGRPIAGASIHAWTAEYTLFGAPALVSVKTDENGLFTIPFAASFVDGALSRLNRISLVVDARHEGYAPRIFRDELLAFMLLDLHKSEALTVHAAPESRVLAFANRAVDLARANQSGVAVIPSFPAGGLTLVLLHPLHVPRVLRLAAKDSREIHAVQVHGTVLRGILKYARDGEPVPGAAVGHSLVARRSRLTFDALESVRTESDGSFQLRTPRDPSGWLAVGADGGERESLVRWTGDPGGPDRVWIDQVRGGELRGTVVDDVGVAVAGARVRIRRRGFEANWTRGHCRMWTAVTRPDGSFVIRGLPIRQSRLTALRAEAWHPRHGAAHERLFPEPAVRLTLRPTKRGGADQRAQPSRPSLTPDGTRTQVVGSVRDLAGEPLAGVVVRGPTPGQNPVTTGDDGRFAISIVGPYPGRVLMEYGSIVRTFDVEGSYPRLDVSMPSSRQLTGRVIHAGAPLAGASVRVVLDGATWERVRTRKDGQFNIQRWPEQGERELVAELTGFLTVRIERPTGGDIELSRAAPFVARVVEENGQSRPNVELRLGERRLVTDMDGIVRLYKAQESKPDFIVEPGGPGWIQMGEPRWSKDGELLTIVVARGERIEGRVVDSENRGVPHILVLARPTVKGRAIRRAFTNSKGYFVLRALHPEHYELRVGDAKHGVQIEAGAKELVLRKESR